MAENGKISAWQAMTLVISFLMGSAILIIPSAAAVSAKQDAWLAIMAATAAGLGIILLNVSLAQKYPGQTFIQYSQSILGRVPGKAAGILTIWFSLHLGSLVTRDFGVFINTTMLPQTPLAVINAMIIVITALTIIYGLEVLARVNELIFPLLLISILAGNLLLLPLMDHRLLLPVLENGLKPVLAGSLIVIGFPFAESYIFVMLLPFIKEQKKAGKALLLGILTGGALLVLVTLSTIMVLGVGNTAASWYPVLEAARFIDLFDIIQRLDAVVIINYMGFGFIKIAVCYFAFIMGLAHWLSLKDFKPLVLPGGVLMLALSILLHENYVELVAFASKIWPPYALTVALVIPLALLLVHSVRGALKKTN